MTAIPLGVSTYERLAAKTARILLINMYLEKDPTNLVDGLLRLQRPGLAAFKGVGTGPIRGVFKKDGVLGGDFIVVSGTQAYRVTEAAVSASLGSIPGTDRVQVAASPTRAIIVANGAAYSTDGSALTTIVVPDIDGVPSLISSVAYINGYFILTVAGSQHFFWLAPGDVNPDALNFASAENTPDNLVGAFHVFDELWFLGTASVEIWQPTGDLDLPFERINGRLYEKGCANRDSVTITDNTLFWVGPDNIVYRGDASPVRVSDSGIEERIRLAGGSTLRAWSFTFDGHLFYCVTVGTQGTFCFDVSTSEWSQFQSYGQTTWRAHVGAQTDGTLIVAGDETTGDLWRLDATVSNDNGVPLVRELIGGVALLGSPVACNNFEAFAATGFAAINTAPVVELRWSDDENIWTSWRQLSLGLQGQYGKRIITRKLGRVKSPGRLFHMRMSDDAVWRISYARMNEALDA